MNRLKGNRIINGTDPTVEHAKEINKIEKSIFNRRDTNVKDKLSTEDQYDELIIPNWTYSTDLGVVYNPIIEKRVKRVKLKKKTKDTDVNINTFS